MKQIRTMSDLQARRNEIELRRLQLEKEMHRNIHDIQAILREPVGLPSTAALIARQLVSSASVTKIASFAGKKILQLILR